MDINTELQSDLVERRRLQNRLAQRKFRGESSGSDRIFMALKWAGREEETSSRQQFSKYYWELK
jgi:hypothetical protein